MENSANTKKSVFIFFSLLSVAVLFTVKREVCMAGAVRGLSFCIATLIPAVFPFSVVCKLLVRTADVSRVGIILAGLVCGAPSGAHTCADAYKNGCCDKRTAEILSAVTNGMTPTFVIGFVGVYCLKSASSGVVVYIICTLSALLYAFVVIKRTQPMRKSPQYFSFSSTFTQAVTESVSAVISLSGFTVFFTVICEFSNAFLDFLPPPTLSIFFLSSELITGILQSAPLRAAVSDRLFFSMMCAFTSFSGICIHLQVRSALSRAGLSARLFLIGKCVQSLTSFIISYIFYGIIFG